MAVGRISGPLLTENLERNGVDLSFRNTLSDTSLLKLFVNDNKIAVNRSSAAVELDITGSQSRTTNLLSTTAKIANFNFDTSNINITSGSITLQGSQGVSVSNLETDNIRISDNRISTFRTNADIELKPTGTQTIFNGLSVDGNITVDNDVTIEGTVTVGNASDDTVDFNVDVNTDIIPRTTDTYNLGSSNLRWRELQSTLVNGQIYNTETFTIDGIGIERRQGNTIYVATNGSDTNQGDHPNGPFATLKKALDFADGSTSGPVNIHVYPGTYAEQLPLEVPSQTTITGHDLRNTIITAAPGYESKDVFLMNGESTVQHLTIKDFYYDSLNDVGYAFRFAPNTIVTSRSPYIQNITVITKGSVTSSNDPRGFLQGDAGKGALVDGADVLSASNEASMLFHSVTFITPGVDALTMTNGVRVEWLNSFTYFANRGLYAVDGVTGHLSSDGSTVKYGAEIRSIGSANVYGNYGAVADGAGTLMYLIQHNFAYIGAGRLVDNDASRSIQTQEVNELNSGKIYFQSIDHKGDFRVGEQFFVSQETGESTIVIDQGQLDSIGGLNVTTNNETTQFTSTFVDTGNIRFSNNDIISTSGTINLQSATTVDFLNNVNITKNLDLTGNLSIDGNLFTLGNQTTDTVDFNVNFSQNLKPDLSGTYSLGKQDKKWLLANLSKANISDVRIQDNYITTNVSNSNLDLRANGTGIIYIENNDVLVGGSNTTINGLTTNYDTNITGNVVQTGDYNIQGNTTYTNFSTTDLIVARNVNIDDFSIKQNNINVTATDTDFILQANGTGKILLPDNDVNIKNNITAGTINVSNLNITSSVALEDFSVSGNIELFDNVITTTESNSDLELRRSGTGSVLIDNFSLLSKTISSTDDIVFDANNDVDISATEFIQIPKGTSADNKELQYSLRYNTDDNLFEAYNTSILSFNGIYSNNRETRATVNNDTIDFTANNISVTRIENAEINSNAITVDSISIGLTDNEISSTGNINLVSGTNTLNIEDLVILAQTEDDSTLAYTITNPTTDSPIKLKGTGSGVREGYWSFSALPALKFPSGDTSTRPTNPVLGQARHNTDTDELEVYNGTEWQTAAGTFDNISAATMEEEAFTQTLIYG